jgi:phosphoglycerate kinase
MESFAKGTIALGNLLLLQLQMEPFSLVGGGDCCCKTIWSEDKMSYVSTGEEHKKC